MAGVETRTMVESKTHHDNLQALRAFHDSDAIRYTDSNLSNTLLAGLNQLRHERQLTDVTLEVGQEKFSCHRSVLAACSPYFKAMFTGGMQESSCNVISLGDVEPMSLQLILDFIYTGAINLSNDSVQNVFSAANLLQVAPVVHFCAEYMEKNLHVVNCVDMYQLACTYSCTNLKEAAWDYLNYHFQDVVNESQVVHASIDVVNDIVQSNQLNVASEDAVLQMVLAWVQWDVMTRRVFMTRLLEYVRFEHIAHDSLQSVIAVNVVPEINCAVEEAIKLNKEAFRSHHDNPPQQKSMQRLGVNARDVLLLMGRNYREHTMCCYHPPSQTSFFIDLPPVCRTLGAKLVVTDANDIYLATDDFREKSVFRFNHIQAKWVKISPRLQGRSNFAIASVHGKIFALGGINDWEILRSVEWYDPARDEWQFASSMPRDVIDFSVATYQNMIYVFSGSRTMKYDSLTDTWIATLPPMPTPRLQTACATNGSEIWLIGGFLAQSSSEVPTVSVESFQPDSNSWSKKEPLPSLLRFCSAVRYHPSSRLYLCGMWCGVHEMGLNIPMQLSSQFDLYDFDQLTSCWTDIAFDIPMQEVQSCAGARVFKR
ncbi:kelch-like protein 28 [Patiria miniata]|uniref:BTB domain-containing protein n=1 Tax=Patiria miniata TaxID=46514 RepID=A0A913ZGX7_PATMI|nr:kelch-like protein 28 [Patiria miniata]